MRILRIEAIYALRLVALIRLIHITEKVHLDLLQERRANAKANGQLFVCIGAILLGNDDVGQCLLKFNLSVEFRTSFWN